ncbi:unnamed protein product [Ilex paraguariensis]|uniref:Crooked neck protein n=1 Tax=Ilex paraguariensis TaxID=185542 RepID=A0ABC8UET5_9AQUA
MQLGRLLKWSPENCYAWSKYAELEKSLSETERARATFEHATNQPALDIPELLWKGYIEFEMSEKENGQGSDLLEGLDQQKQQCLKLARRVFERALNHFTVGWLNMEIRFGDIGDVNLVFKKRQQVEADGTPVGYECIDHLLSDEKTQTTNLKILEAAYNWKKHRTTFDRISKKWKKQRTTFDF